MIDLFIPSIVKLPGQTRTIRLVDIETKEEARYRQRCEALIKARAAVRNPGRKPTFTADEAKSRRREAKSAYEARRYQANKEAMREAARLRMADLRAKRRLPQIPE